MKYNPLLLCDFYKVTHSRQYPKDISKIVSYFTPRTSRIDCDELVVFGLQGFIKTYLTEYFNKNFFEKSLDEVKKEYSEIIKNTLGETVYDLERVVELHNLGYLPIEIKALLEGTMCPIHVPFLEISNTHPKFAWVTNWVESLLSAETWHPMVSATIGKKYRDIVNKYYDLTVDDNVRKARALGDFSFRGQECLQSAVKSSAGFLLSFLNSATVPSIVYLQENYNCDCRLDEVGYGSVSTEHSVMCSNYSVDGDETSFIKRMITELYPNDNFSIVCDSYDYWNVVKNIIPQLKEEILNRDKTVFVRGDSGNPVEIVTQTVFELEKIFGSTINSKGYNVLPTQIRAIYGDSITVQRCEEIYKILEQNGFASNNVSLGVGSFSMQCIEENGVLKPFTRDTFGMAVKATYGKMKDGKEIKIFKNPKTDSDNFKKSQKGLCVVKKENDKLVCVDDLLESEYQAMSNENEMVVVYRNGEVMHQETLSQIRNRLHNNKF